MKTQKKKSENLRYQPKPYVEINNPEWCKKATIYEVNIRQYTPKGTFRAFMEHLPRLKDLGVDILWFMPIHPIGIKNRKGTLGSYYAVKDYYEINPEFGTKDDFHEMVKAIHDMDMYLILDWVANHTSADNLLIEKHPEWYSKTPWGKMQPTPWLDWDDVLDLDYNQPALRRYMTKAMKYWVHEFDIDGFRADVAGFVPLDFWENLREELEAIKPVFLLAEWEERDLHRKAFDMTYSWRLWGNLRDVASGKKSINSLLSCIATHIKTYPPEAIKMNFIDNHDKNSWDGTPFTIFGDGLETAMVFTCVVSGMPLIYSGQETGQNRSLSFFDKDCIEWKHHEHYNLYKTLFALKKRNQSLWNGKWGGEMIQLSNNHPDKVISFLREKDGDRIIALFNFSDQPVKVELKMNLYCGKYLDLFQGCEFHTHTHNLFSLDAWGYKILEWDVTK